MSTTAITAFPFDVPFRTSFKHASKTRARADSVLVRIGEHHAPDVGWGEACPRNYVTGETVEGVTRFVGTIGPQLIREVDDIDGFKKWMIANRASIDANPAAFCALELALLDRWGRQSGVPVEHLICADPAPRDIVYSAVLGDSVLPKFAAQALAYRAYGLSDAKVKLGADGRRNCRRLRLLRRILGPRSRIRIDANNLWTESENAISQLSMLATYIWAAEEPLKARDFNGCRRIFDACGLRIILDESVTRLADLDALAPDPERWIVNVRVSKMGGLLRSIEFAKAAQASGIDVLIGAHVGETSILTRAALALARLTDGPPLAMEGGFGERLLTRDVVTEPIVFGRGGRLDEKWRSHSGQGLGLKISFPPGER